jgi:hypothetical protein
MQSESLTMHQVPGAWPPVRYPKSTHTQTRLSIQPPPPTHTHLVAPQGCRCGPGAGSFDWNLEGSRAQCPPAGTLGRRTVTVPQAPVSKPACRLTLLTSALVRGCGGLPVSEPRSKLLRIGCKYGRADSDGQPSKQDQTASIRPASSVDRLISTSHAIATSIYRSTDVVERATILAQTAPGPLVGPAPTAAQLRRPQLPVVPHLRPAVPLFDDQ